MKFMIRLGCLVLAALLVCGCARSYVISLSNGGRIVCSGKPRLKEGYYTYKDARGEKHQVSELRVREVAPASMSQAEFNPDGKSSFLPK